MGEYGSTQTLVIHHWEGPSVIAQLIFLRKSDCFGCAVLLCLVVCLTLLASSFFLISHYNVYTCILGVCLVSLVVSLPRPSPSY